MVDHPHGPRRSSLPGGTRPPADLPPGTLPAGLHPVPPVQRRALGVGSLTLSGVLADGILFAIVTLAGVRAETLGPLWPGAIPLVLAAATITLVVRGSRGLARRRTGAGRDLVRGRCLGAASAGLMPVLVWLWRADVVLKGTMSAFMGPMALAAAWGGLSAARRLRAAGASAPPLRRVAGRGPSSGRSAAQQEETASPRARVVPTPVSRP